MKFVVTGNIGCGKSTAINYFKQNLPDDFVYLDYDQGISELYQQSEFQQELFTAIGTFDKKKISDIIFGEDREKAISVQNRVERIGSKYMRQWVYSQFITAPGNIIFECPMFFEIGSYFDPAEHCVITVYCSPETQKARVMKRNGFTEEKVNIIMANQFSNEFKVDMSYLRVNTDGEKAETERKLEDVVISMKDLASRKKKPTFYGASPTLVPQCEMDLQSRFFKDYSYRNSNYLVPIWQALRNNYTAKDRKYHNLNHLQQMFDVYDQVVTDFVHNRDIMCMAIWYHDYVYHPGLPNNEVRSLHQMYADSNWDSRAFQSLGMPSRSELGITGEMILSTKTHQITSPLLLNNPDLFDDTALFLDIDMSIFSTDTETYFKYVENIRDEYLTVYPNEAYVVGRTAFLNKVLAQDKIFFNDGNPRLPMFSDANARFNILEELDFLKIS